MQTHIEVKPNPTFLIIIDLFQAKELEIQTHRRVRIEIIPTWGAGRGMSMPLQSQEKRIRLHMFNLMHLITKGAKVKPFQRQAERKSNHSKYPHRAEGTK